MKKNIISIALLSGIVSTILIGCSSGSTTEQRPLVTIKNGSLLGIETNGMLTFKNIPYAAPPVGPLRWRPPMPAINWSGIRDASQFGAACIQPFVQGLNQELVPGSEDCLKLNVYTPKTGNKLPVMVWFHGGALEEGSAIEPYYQPIGLVNQGVIVVTVDYRLGPLGFFAPQELVNEAESAHEPFGNYGTMDQIYSLKWVRDNISAFGGDPNNVTIFGQSAGGRSVTSLMTSPQSNGLFNKAIAQSAQQLPMKTMQEAETIAAKYMESLGVSTLAQLRALPAESFALSNNQPYSGAMIDGQVIIGDAIPLFKSGKQHPVPFMIGFLSWDASYFVPSQPPLESYVAQYNESMGIINSLYSDFPYTCAETAEVKADGWYGAATKHLADYANKLAPSYAYYYSYLSPTLVPSHIGPAHTFELPYVFGDLNNVLIAPTTPEPDDVCTQIIQAANDLNQSNIWSPYWYPTTAPSNPEDQSISLQLAQSWTSFAKTGNPNPDPKNQTWPRYDIKTDIMRQFSNGTLGNVQYLNESRINYQWEKAVYPTYFPAQ